MRRITLIFALLLSLMGVRQAKAQAITDSFEDWGSTIPSGWDLKNATYGNSYGYTYVVNNDYEVNSGTKALWSTDNTSTSTAYLITPQLKGDVSFYFRKYNSSSSTKGYIYIYEYNDEEGTVGTTALFRVYPNGINEATSKYQQGSFNVGNEPKRLAILLAKVVIDDFTYTPVEESVDGPALKVTGDDNGSLNYGMVNPSTTKELTLSNPGTQDITVSIATTGGFSAASSKTIAAGGEEKLAIAAPTTVGACTGKVTITPTVNTVAAVTINLRCTVKDPAKVYETLGDGTAPEEWKATSWSFTTGYAFTTSWYQSSNARLVTPLLNVLEGETFSFEAMGTYDGYQSLVFEYSVDGTNWTASSTTITLGSEWASYTISDIPAGTYYIALHGSQVRVRNFYGGELDQTPRPKLEVEGIANGGSLSWGYSDVPAGSTKTITLKNDGTADLDVTIAATNNYTVDPAAATVVAGGTFEVTIGTPANDGPGVLTITPAEGSGLSPYTINLTSYWKEPKPVMAIDKTSVAFGRVNEVTSETVTVSNTGDADLVVTIANDNTTNFSVEPAEQLIVAAGEEGTITITYNFAEGTWGTFNANVKLTPNYGGTYDVKTITVSATSKDPNVWSEDFEEGTMATTWNNEGGWTVSQPTASGNNGTYMATISSYNNPKSLTTPRLEAKVDDKLTFYVGMQYGDEPLTIEYTNDDKATWNAVVGPVTASGEITFTAPADGFYYIRFTGTYAMLDDFNGFKLAMKDHEIEISANNIPATGTQYAEYTATATVKELVGVEEEVTAKLIVNDEEVATATEIVPANGTASFTLTYVPETAIENAGAKIVVTYAGGELATEEATVNIAPAPVLNETAASAITTGTVDALVLKYTPKNGWNTICVPFALTDDILNQIFGEGWKAYEFKGYNDGEFTFYKPSFYAAGYPYLVFTENAPVATDGYKLENINITAATALSDNYGGVTFHGTYAPAGTMEGLYGVVPNTNDVPTIMKGGASATLKGYRGYFEIPSGEVKSFSFTFVDDATGIRQFVATPENGAIYDLNGNKVKNLVKGQVYIMNGQKILVK